MKKENKSVKNRDITQVKDLISQAYKLMHSHPKKCIELSNKALKLSKKLHFEIGQGMAYMHKGLGYFHQSIYNKALKSYLKSESFFLKTNYWFGLRSLYNNIGLVYHEWDNLEKALKYYHKNLKLSEKYNDPKLSSTILNNIGRTYLNPDEYDKAVKYFSESLQVCEESDLPYMKSVCYDNLGKTYLKLGDNEKARNYYDKSISIKKEIDDFSGLDSIYQSIALLHIEKQEYKKALKNLDRALFYADKVNEQTQIANIYLKYAEIYKDLHKKTKQKEFLEKSLKIAEANDYISQKKEVFFEFAQVYEKENKYKTALEFYKKYEKIKGIQSAKKRIRAIEEIKTTLEVEKTEREKEILQQKNNELKLLNKQIMDQKQKLEVAERELQELNHDLEKRVNAEIKKSRKQEQILMQKSKLESLGRMSAGIAHEINQPVGLIKIATQNLFHKFKQKKITEKYLKKKSAFVEENITRINKIIEHIRLFSRDQQQETQQKIDIKEILENALSMIQIQFKNHNITIQNNFENLESGTIGNKYRLEQVFLNLLSNARDSLEDKFDELDDAKKIVIRLKTNNNKIIIEVEDNGCGIEQKYIEHVFEPFYTTKSESKGTGLGLSICYGIIQEMNGSINLESQKGKGTTVSIVLPAYKINNKIKNKDRI